MSTHDKIAWPQAGKCHKGHHCQKYYTDDGCTQCNRATTNKQLLVGLDCCLRRNITMQQWFDEQGIWHGQNDANAVHDLVKAYGLPDHLTNSI